MVKAGFSVYKRLCRDCGEVGEVFGKYSRYCKKCATKRFAKNLESARNRKYKGYNIRSVVGW